MPCNEITDKDGNTTGFICSGNRGIAPVGFHFGWDDDLYPVITNDPANVIRCMDCSEPAITVNFWAYELNEAYCANCAWVHKDIFPKSRRRRQYGETLEDDK